MATGSIKFFKSDGGFGFITEDEPTQDRDLFFHIFDVVEADKKTEFSKGLRVSYDLAASSRGMCGVNVEVVSK